jgi:tetratricopeptide (TPR) repeat protein
MRLIDALIQYPTIPIFSRVEGPEPCDDDIRDWEFEPIDAPVLRESDGSNFFIVKAKHVLPDRTIRDCYLDLCLPERISDYAYFLRGDDIERRYLHECEGEVICAIPIDCFGVYDLFYSRIAPEVSINILRKGLAMTAHQQYIAEDLAYILRDERRFAEAAEMFQLAADGEPSSYFIYNELAGCYQEIGELAKAEKYFARYNSQQD